MKIANILIALAAIPLAAPPLAAIAAGEHDGHGALTPATKMQSQAPAKLVDGQVKKIDKTAGKLTLAHGPLTNLGMDTAMTMAFRVKDAAWLDQMKVGDKIRFMAEDASGVLTIVRFEPAQ